MSQHHEDYRRMSALAEQAAVAAARGNAACLSLLLTEMQALCALLPGMPGAAACADDEARARQTDAEVEAGFDNMPV